MTVVVAASSQDASYVYFRPRVSHRDMLTHYWILKSMPNQDVDYKLISLTTLHVRTSFSTLGHVKEYSQKDLSTIASQIQYLWLCHIDF